MANGRITHLHSQRSHSWVRNAYNCVLTQLAGINCDGTYAAGSTGMKQIGGTVASGKAQGLLREDLTCEDPTTLANGLVSPAATIYGIAVGSNNTAESFEDYKINTKIAHGNAAGQLSYGQSLYPATKSYVAGTKTYTAIHTRYFNNNSGGDVTVRECTIEMQNQSTVYCTCRDVFADVVVPNTGQLKVTYTFTLTYPA